ncbi:hypothetical protein GCM10010349_32450 [Streptomyces flavofungini]|nr:hypothetical protein GCM10010349_32450 [Streptomyces flavofungini]
MGILDRFKGRAKDVSVVRGLGARDLEQEALPPQTRGPRRTARSSQLWAGAAPEHGDHMPRAYTHLITKGSSPHARGPLPLAALQVVQPGTTPAPTGTSDLQPPPEKPATWCRPRAPSPAVAAPARHPSNALTAPRCCQRARPHRPPLPAK